MSKITWNTNVNAPCYPGEIVGPSLEQERDERGRFLPIERLTILVDSDWEYCRTASTFGWSLENVQVCPVCKHVQPHGNQPFALCRECGEQYGICHHETTDGTVDCKNCGLTASEFMSAAYDWLDDNNGATANDPGYF